MCIGRNLGHGDIGKGDGTNSLQLVVVYFDTCPVLELLLLPSIAQRLQTYPL